MKRAIGLALVLVVLLAAPGYAHVSVSPSSVSSGEPSMVQTDDDAHGASAAETRATDDGVDGTDPATFIALEVGGLALVAAVAALIMGRKRIPS